MTARSDEGQASSRLPFSGGLCGGVLLSRRLRLDPLAVADIERLHDIWIDPQVRRHLFDDEVVTQTWLGEEVERSQESFATSGYGSWCVRRRGESRIVGFVGLRCFRGADEPQIYYGLDPQCWGEGFATEAVEAVTHLAFQHLGFTRLLAGTDEPNLASQRLLDRLGMDRVEERPAESRATRFYALTREGYEKLTLRLRPDSASARSGKDKIEIRLYRSTDFRAVEHLWQEMFPSSTPYHQPEQSVRLKIADSPDLFFVADAGEGVVGTVLAGWDGHRGWIYSLAVEPRRQRQGIARRLLSRAVEALEERGCPKVGLQVRANNQAVVAFYQEMGFVVEERVSMGMRVGIGDPP